MTWFDLETWLQAASPILIAAFIIFIASMHHYEQHKRAKRKQREKDERRIA